MLLTDFKPTRAVQGSAFGWVFKGLVLLVFLGCAGQLGLLWQRGEFRDAASQSLVLPALGVLLVMLAAVWVSRTKVEADHIEQVWLWKRRVNYQDMAFARLFRVRGFEWLIAPRLFVRTIGNRPLTLYAADAAVIFEFERIDRLSRASKLR